LSFYLSSAFHVDKLDMGN